MTRTRRAAPLWVDWGVGNPLVQAPSTHTEDLSVHRHEHSLGGRVGWDRACGHNAICEAHAHGMVADRKMYCVGCAVGGQQQPL